MARLVLIACALLVSSFAWNAEALPRGVTKISGDVVEKGDRATASEAGATLRLPGGTTIKAEPGTALRFVSVLRLKLGPPGTPERTTRAVHLLEGGLEVVPKPGGHAVMVMGSRGASAVFDSGRGVAFARSEATTFVTYAGQALIGYRVKWRPLLAGHAAMFTRRSPQGKIGPLPKPPVVSATKPVGVVVGSNETRVEFAWPRVNEAVEYDVVIEHAGTRRVERTRMTHHAVRATSPGIYRIVVRTRDRWGVVSGESTPAEARVARVVLPEGATARGNELRLGYHQRARLEGAQGLEISYGRAGYFVPAPRDVGLNRGRAVVARFRSAGSDAEAVVELVPNRVEASIRLGPARAQWPRDTITAAIDLGDADAARSVEPKVTVNVTPVSVRWRRSGTRLVGEVPKPKARGPWVVRVEVHDRNGRTIARDFLEVDRGKPPPRKKAKRRRVARRKR